MDMRRAYNMIHIKAAPIIVRTMDEMPEVPMKSRLVVYHSRALALACAAALSAPAAPAAGQAEPVEAAALPPAAMTYSVVNLGIGWPTAIPKINNRGQVAFSVRNFSPRSDLGYRALFYDRTTIRDIGNVGRNRSRLCKNVVSGKRIRLAKR